MSPLLGAAVGAAAGTALLHTRHDAHVSVGVATIAAMVALTTCLAPPAWVGVLLVVGATMGRTLDRLPGPEPSSSTELA